MEKIKYILLVAIVLLASCNQSEDEETLLDQRKKKIETIAYERAFKVGVMPTMDCLPLFVMCDSALYDTTKVDIRLKMYTSQNDCDTAIMRNKIQACVTDLVRAEYLKKKKKASLQYMTETNASWKLLVSPNSGIKSLNDLGDKVIALNESSATWYYTGRVVDIGRPRYAVYGAAIGDVFLRLDMLLNKQMDGIWASEPQATQAKLKGNIVLYDTSADIFVPGAFVYVGKNDPKVSRVFEKAYDRAIDLINKNSVQYYSDIIKKYMKVDDNVIKALPKMKYKHISYPRQSNINEALHIKPAQRK